MKNLFAALKAAPALIFNILKYLPVILVIFKALEMVQKSIENVQNSDEDVSKD